MSKLIFLKSLRKLGDDLKNIVRIDMVSKQYIKHLYKFRLLIVLKINLFLNKYCFKKYKIYHSNLFYEYIYFNIFDITYIYMCHLYY